MNFLLRYCLCALAYAVFSELCHEVFHMENPSNRQLYVLLGCKSTNIRKIQPIYCKFIEYLSTDRLSPIVQCTLRSLSEVKKNIRLNSSDTLYLGRGISGMAVLSLDPTAVRSPGRDHQ